MACTETDMEPQTASKGSCLTQGPSRAHLCARAYLHTCIHACKERERERETEREREVGIHAHVHTLQNQLFNPTTPHDGRVGTNGTEFVGKSMSMQVPVSRSFDSFLSIFSSAALQLWKAETVTAASPFKVSHPHPETP